MSGASADEHRHQFEEQLCCCTQGKLNPHMWPYVTDYWMFELLKHITRLVKYPLFLLFFFSQAPTPQQREMMEEAAARIAQDNCELACCFIQKTAVEKAGPEMDKRLATVRFLLRQRFVLAVIQTVDTITPYLKRNPTHPVVLF